MAARSPTPTGDDRPGGGVHEHADGEQRDLPAVQPLRAAPGHHPHRLAGHRRISASTDGICTTSTTCSIRSACSRARRCRPSPTNRSAARHQLSGRSHLGGPLEHGQRGSHQRRMERPADQPRGRQLAAGDLWLPVSGALRGRASSPAASPTSTWPASPNLGRAVTSRCSRRRPTSAFQDTTTWITRRPPARSAAGVAISRNRKDQNGRAAYLGALNFSTAGNPNTTGNSVADALLGNFRTYNEASARSGGLLPLHQPTGVRLGQLARSRRT